MLAMLGRLVLEEGVPGGLAFALVTRLHTRSSGGRCALKLARLASRRFFFFGRRFNSLHCRLTFGLGLKKGAEISLLLISHPFGLIFEALVVSLAVIKAAVVTALQRHVAMGTIIESRDLALDLDILLTGPAN